MFCAARRVECSRELQSAAAVVFAMAGAKRQAVADPAARRSACVKTLALLVMLSVFCASLGAEPPAARLAVTAPSAPLPQRLSDTGLYVADSLRVRADNIAFAPQYPLWSDGTSKRRWIYLPPGAVDRCVASRCVGISGRHASVEGIRLRPPRRDALHRATGGRFMALRCVRLEHARHGCSACGGGWCGAASQRGARRPLRCSVTQRLPGVP